MTGRYALTDELAIPLRVAQGRLELPGRTAPYRRLGASHASKITRPGRVQIIHSCVARIYRILDHEPVVQPVGAPASLVVTETGFQDSYRPLNCRNVEDKSQGLVFSSDHADREFGHSMSSEPTYTTDPGNSGGRSWPGHAFGAGTSFML